jgi:hypothetical protein
MLSSSSLILENLSIPSNTIKQSSVSKSVTHKFNIEENLNETFQKTIEDMDNIVDFILKTDVDKLEESLYQKSFVFELKFKTLTRILLNQAEEAEENLINLEYNLYEELIKSLEDVFKKEDTSHNQDIIKIIKDFRNYEIILLKTALEEPDTLNDALNKIRIEELRKFVSESTLLLCCILSYFTEGLNDYNKLSKLIELTNKRIDILLTFVNSINLLTDKPVKISIDNEIGKVTENENGFYVNLEKMNPKKKYKIKYDITEFQVEKDNNNLVLKEII